MYLWSEVDTNHMLATKIIIFKKFWVRSVERVEQVKGGTESQIY